MQRPFKRTFRAS